MTRIKTSDKQIDWEVVREIAFQLPNVEDGLSYGAPALKINGKHLFIRWREDLNAVVVKTTFEERDELMAADPEVYFITDHYLNYEWVLVSLENVGENALGEMIRRAHRLASAGKKT